MPLLAEKRFNDMRRLLALLVLGGVTAATPLASAEEPEIGASGRPVSWARVVPNVLQDQARIWTYPVELAKARHIGPTLAFAFATGTAIALDPADTPYFRRTQTFSAFNRTFSSMHTALGTAAAPAALYLAGLASHDPYARRTALLCVEAGADVEILDGAMKAMTRRLRPSDIPPNGDFTHSFYGFSGSLAGSVSRTAFPSGHTIAAFGVATVIADRYRHKRWVPWVAYGLATAVGLSRVTLQAHFPSDVLAGAILGYAVGHYVVPAVR